MRTELVVPIACGTAALFYLCLKFWQYWRVERPMNKQLEKTMDDILHPKNPSGGKPV